MKASRVQAPETVENLEASVGDVPKQGSGPQRDLRDDAIIAQVMAIIYAECDKAKVASNLASEQGRKADMYRYNTALHSLWNVAAGIAALKQEGLDAGLGGESAANERTPILKDTNHD